MNSFIAFATSFILLGYNCIAQDTARPQRGTMVIAKPVYATERDTVSIDSSKFCNLYIKGITQQIKITPYGTIKTYSIKRKDLLKAAKLGVIGCKDTAYVTSFNMTFHYSVKNTFNGTPYSTSSKPYNSTNEYFTNAQLIWIKKLNKGCFVDIQNILCKTQSGETKNVYPITLEIN